MAGRKTQRSREPIKKDLAYHVWLRGSRTRKMCMPFGAGKVCYVRPRGGGW
nr:MAG TPA: hypothetical protein [Caudoviricetes sp.]